MRIFVFKGDKLQEDKYGMLMFKRGLVPWEDLELPMAVDSHFSEDGKL